MPEIINDKKDKSVSLHSAGDESMNKSYESDVHSIYGNDEESSKHSDSRE